VPLSKEPNSQDLNKTGFDQLNQKEKIILSSFLNNERALNLYQKIGFKKIGIRKNQFYMENKYFDEILMDLWIDEYLKTSDP